MTYQQHTAQATFGHIAPKLAALSDQVLFGEIWERSELSKRDRSLITVATLIALNRVEQLSFHIKYAQDNGVNINELVEVITHLAFYSGWPTAVAALMILDKNTLPLHCE